MKLLMIALTLLFSMSAYSLEELDFSSYLASNDSIAGVGSAVQSVQTISQGQYIGGGVVGTVFGFGIGHAVQERWFKNRLDSYNSSIWNHCECNTYRQDRSW